MGWIDRLALGQRIVLVIAWGAVLTAFGTWVTNQHAAAGGGWFGYAPNTSVTFSPGHQMSVGHAALIAAGLSVAWAAVSVILMRPPRRHGDA